MSIKNQFIIKYKLCINVTSLFFVNPKLKLLLYTFASLHNLFLTIARSGVHNTDCFVNNGLILILFCIVLNSQFVYLLNHFLCFI